MSRSGERRKRAPTGGLAKASPQPAEAAADRQWTGGDTQPVHSGSEEGAPAAPDMAATDDRAMDATPLVAAAAPENRTDEVLIPANQADSHKFPTPEEIIEPMQDTMQNTLENGFETARQSAATLMVRALEAAKAQADASFALASGLIGAKTLTDALELQAAFARKQMDIAAAQMREFQSAAQQAFVEAAKPTREAFEKAFAAS